MSLEHLRPGGRSEDETMCLYQLRDGRGRGSGGSRGRHGLSVVQPHNLKEGMFIQLICYAIFGHHHTPGDFQAIHCIQPPM